MLASAKTLYKGRQRFTLRRGNTAVLLRPCACHPIGLDERVDTHSKEFNILTSCTCKLTRIKKKINLATQPIK